MENQIHKVIILGSGPAGLTAALYASRADLEPVLLAGNDPGGQLMWTTEVENFPGFPNGIMGPELMQNMIKQVENFGTKIIYETATEVDFSQQPLKIKTPKQELLAHTVIVATGASARWLGLESEQKLRGKGVTACATCDGAFFKEKEVFVVGAGDSALEEAQFLTKFASKVTVLVRGTQENMRASKIMQQRALNHEKISFMFETEVQEVLGEEKMTGVRVINKNTKETQDLPGDGLFVAIGHKPNTDIFKGILDMHDNGYLKVHDQTKTNKDCVFVAGDVFDYRYRQAITAAGSGCMAALDVEKALAAKEIEVQNPTSTYN